MTLFTQLGRLHFVHVPLEGTNANNLVNILGLDGMVGYGWTCIFGAACSWESYLTKGQRVFWGGGRLYEYES